MDKNSIIHRGDVVKYRITITHRNFDQYRDDFYVILHYGMTGCELRIDKEDMICENNENWILTFPTSSFPSGFVKAETHYFVGDADFYQSVREEAEWDCIGFVSDNPCPRLACNCHCGDCASQHVRFERIMNSSPYKWLRTVLHEPIACSDSRVLRVRKVR